VMMGEPVEQHPDLDEEVSGFSTLEHVLDWMGELGVHGSEVDVVAQDEFNHDFLVKVGPGDRWVVFGVT